MPENENERGRVRERENENKRERESSTNERMNLCLNVCKWVLQRVREDTPLKPALGLSVIGRQQQQRGCMNILGEV